MKTIIYTPRSCYANDGSVAIDMHGMSESFEVECIAITLRDSSWPAGLSSGFHMSVAEARELAAQLLRHANATKEGEEA